MSLTRLALARPKAGLFALLLLGLAGLDALRTLPRQEDPTLTHLGSLILARLPGAPAERVDARIVVPLSEALRGIPEIDYVEAMARPGLATLRVVLQEEVLDAEPAWRRIRARVEDARGQLPRGVEGPIFQDDIQETFAFLVALSGDGVELADLDLLARDLTDHLRRVPGAAKAERFGDPRETLEVQLDPEALRSRGLTPRQVAAALQGSDVEAAAGRLEAEGRRVVVQAGREWASADEVAQTVLRVGRDGEPVRISEVARLVRSPMVPEAPRVLADGRPAVVVGLRLVEGARVDLFSARIREALAEFAAGLPAGIRLDVLLDQGEYTRVRIEELGANLLQSVALVALVTAFFLGFWPGLLVASVLPVTSLMVLLAFRLLGIPIHQMSVVGLVLAMGLLIDAATVVAEHLGSLIDAGLDPQEAALKGVEELRLPLLVSSAAIAASFLPILLMPGASGEFVGSIALGVVVALAFSYLVALTYTPVVTVFLHRVARPRPWFSLKDSTWWKSCLEAIVRRPGLAVGVGLALLLPTFGTLYALERDFFPASDRGQLVVSAWLEGGTPRGRTMEVARELDRRLRAHPGVLAAAAFVGRSAPNFYYNLMGAERDTEEYVQFLVNLAPGSDPTAVALALDGTLPAGLPEAAVLVRPLGQGPPYMADVEIRIQGPDPRMQRRLAEQVEGIVAGSGLFAVVRANVGHDRPQARLRVDHPSLAVLGLTPADAAEAMLARLDGLPAGDLREGDRILPVLVRGGERGRSGPGELLRTGLPGGAPLAAVGSLEIEAGYGGLARRTGEPTLTVEAWPRLGLRPAMALDAVRPALEALDLPQGYALAYGGEDRARRRTEASLFASLPLSLGLVLLCLFLEFESVRLVGLVAWAIPLSVGPALAGLWLTGLPLGFTAILGLLSMAGIVISDSVILLDGYEAERAKGRSLREAVVAVTLERSGHVLVTSTTDVAGYLPLVLAGGEFWAPLAVAQIFGLTSLTLLTLVMLPALYLLAFDRAPDPRPELAGATA